MNATVANVHSNSCDTILKYIACRKKRKVFFRNSYAKQYGAMFMDKLRRLALDLFDNFKCISDESVLSKVSVRRLLYVNLQK